MDNIESVHISLANTSKDIFQVLLWPLRPENDTLGRPYETRFDSKGCFNIPACLHEWQLLFAPDVVAFGFELVGKFTFWIKERRF